jgi:Fe-S-cluster-containing dehydrogenase component
MEEDGVFYPVVAGPFNNAECTSKNIFIIEGKEVDECIICRASCPIKPWFKEPDTGVLLKCDFCGDPPEPACVKWCPCQAITLVDEEGHLTVKIEDMSTWLNKHRQLAVSWRNWTRPFPPMIVPCVSFPPSWLNAGDT